MGPAARLGLHEGIRDRDVRVRPFPDADGALEERLLQSVDDKTLALIQRRRQSKRPKDRGWLLRRLLLAGDLLGLCCGYLLAAGASGTGGSGLCPIG